MGIVELLIMLAIGAVAGWLAGNLIRGGGFGLIGNIVVGVIGSFIGTFLSGMLLKGGLGVDIPGWLGTLIFATIGAVILLFIISLIKRV